MADVPIIGGSSGGAGQPGIPPPADVGETYVPAMTAGFDKTVTALVKQEILENLRETARWMVPGSYVPGKLIAGTNLIRHIAYGDLSVAANGSELPTEGTPPDEEPLSIGFHEYSVTQKGRLVGVTDVAMDLSPHELMSVAAERVGYDALMTIDRSIAAAVTIDPAGSTGLEGLTLAGPAAGAALTAAMLRRWVTDMKVAFIPTFSDGFYVAMVHPDVVFDLQNDTAIGGWIEASKYAQPDRLLSGEIGRMHGVRFVETTIGTYTGVAGDDNDTYNTVVFGPDYYAFGDLQSVQSYMVRPGGDHSDPLAQKGLVGYKGMWGAAPMVDDLAASGPKYGIAYAHGSTTNRLPA